MATRPICTSCWNKRYPENRANTGGPVHGAVEVCQDCGGLTSANLVDAGGCWCSCRAKGRAPVIFPIECCAEERTRQMLGRAWVEDGDDREATRETHGQISLERAPYQELRKHYGLAYSVAWWESGRVEFRDEAPE